MLVQAPRERDLRPCEDEGEGGRGRFPPSSHALTRCRSFDVKHTLCSEVESIARRDSPRRNASIRDVQILQGDASRSAHCSPSSCCEAYLPSGRGSVSVSP